MKAFIEASLPIVGLKKLSNPAEGTPVVCGYCHGKDQEAWLDYIRQSCQLHHAVEGGSRCYDFHMEANGWFKCWQVEATDYRTADLERKFKKS